MSNLSQLLNQAKADIAEAQDLTKLDLLRIKYLGRQGALTENLRKVGDLDPAARAQQGAEANQAKKVITTCLEERRAQLDLQTLEAIEAQPIDLTAPGIIAPLGHRHPVSRILEELTEVFWQMGYQVFDGPEIETVWHNFEALNIGPDHPARDLQDTFYLTDPFSNLLPRTHTSGVQIRHMQANKPPIRIIAPGKVYRNEDEDARHSWIFYQIEGLVVDKGISLADLKGTLLAMMRGVLGDDTKVRLRPNYFPYTEPSVEMDATCASCSGTGIQNGATCGLCGGTGWLELGGAGMVHPNVLRNCGIDPSVYTGFAFGFGPERIATIKYGIDDVREFWRPDMRFLGQFN